MAGTGINVTETNTLSPYFPEMNLYAARVNYLMQQGSPSKDVALYMPYNGSLSETDAVKAMNYNGIAWDAINDASIQAADTVYEDGKISANGGKMTYQAIVVEGTTLPVATMEKLKELATVILYGNAPAKQPGYADGKYAAGDAKVAACAAEIIAQENGSNPKIMADLEKALAAVKRPSPMRKTQTSVLRDALWVTAGSWSISATLTPVKIPSPSRPTGSIRISTGWIRTAVRSIGPRRITV
ncbi:MAG TPA: hypothetical protein DF613_14000 [Lachnospiraceae bacterium]|nr:hypothetical protein [Lachnospiraceae bacterium]